MGALGVGICPGAAVVASNDQPTYGTATVDGSYSEWDLSGDWFADMWEAGKPDKDKLSKLYLRYDCEDHILYALVLRENDFRPSKKASDAWIKIYNLGNSPRVDGNSGKDGIPPDFMWVYSGSSLIGYEASFSLPEGTYNFEAHIQISPGRTSSTGKKGNYLTLVIDCPEIPSIDIEKATNDVDADELTGPVLSKGDLVTWTYVVKNTGNVPLTDVYVVDDVVGVVAGPISLDAGDSQKFTKTGTAVAGQYSNTAKANGTYDGTKVDDEDPSHYFGSDPAISIEKATNGDDADTETGPAVPVGSTVTWTYKVTNTGNVPLTDVYVVDDVIGVVAGPISLDAGESQKFTKTGTAVAGQYSNMATANGTYDGTKVEDTDPSHYIVNPDPSIDIEKATNDVDADELTGPVLSKGDMVTWTYVVKNTGNVPLTDVYVVDDVIGVVAGPISLDAGKSQTFTKTGTAELGQYSNMATANGTYDGTKVEDTDPSHYVVQPDPSIDIEKATNGYDADEPTGPILNVGDEVTWSYVVTNTGNVPLTSVYVVDDVIGVVAGPINLGLGESQTSTKTGTAELGQYSNIATANGTYDGTEVYDDDPSHYFGSAPLEPVVLEPGLEVYKTASPISGTPCDDVIFTIVVMNTGEFPLILEVTDTIPPGMSYVSSSPEPDIAMKNANGSWTVVWKSNLEALDPGNSTEILLVAHIDEDIPASSSPDNVLTILSSSEDEVLRIQQVSGGMAEKLQDLEWMKVRLEIELRKMIELRERFDKDAADLKVETPPSEGAGYTVYNYTDSVTEENLVLFEDSQGNLAISEYINPKLDAVLTTEYGPRGVAISDSYLSRDGMEGLRIDYYMPYAGYRVYTINYRTGDTLIDTFDARGNLINREYRRTPGIPKEKVFTVRNCVTATGTYEAGQVSASDCADVTVNYLSDLKLTKVPSPTTATVGTPVLYTYTVENTGTTTISNILLFDDKLNQLVDLNRTVLKPGETAIGTATYTVLFEDLPGPVINNATVTGTDPQGTELTDLASATVPIYYSEIVLVKTPDKTGVVVGDVVTYTYLVTNIGTTTITDLTLFDDKLNKFLPLNRTTIGPGESAMATAEYEALAEDIPGPIVNNATVEGIDEKEDPVTAEDFASVDILQPQIQLSGLTVTKIADKTEVRPGEEVVYNITICNYHGIVDVIDTFNRDVEFVSADPSPNVGHRRQIWKSLSIDGCRSITLVVRTKKPQNFTFDMDQGVEGVGFVNVANDYNTAYPTYVLINNVEVTEPDNPENILNRTTENVYVRDLGTELETREHGSGTYENEEQIRMRTANKSISMDKDVSATYSKTNLGLYNNRTVTYSSKWTEEAKAKNWITGASLTESYRYADFIDRESSFDVDENGSIMEFETEFSGMGHVGALKKSDPNDTARDTPIFELREDYVGTFRTYQKVDEYGKNVGYEASTSGEGFVAADRRVGESQRSYEYGSGSYNSEDLIRTETNYIAKDISLVYAPTSHSLTDDVSVDSSMKWKEGMYSRTKGISYIGEEYTSIDRLEKESIFRGLNDLSSEADFSGTARYRVMLADETGNASGNGADKEAMIDFDEIYTGDYSVAKRIVLTGVPKYNRPHLSVAKIGKIDSGSSLAEYTITVTNDGNVVLDTISIEDTFPQGTEFLSASLRPTEVTSDTAKWNNILSLPVGDVLAIDLVLNVTDYSGHLVNVVKATAQHGENLTLSATNFSVLDASWLSCCPSEVFASKTATIDPVLQNVVTYRLTVQNLAESPAVARIDDEIPSGMKLLGSSVMPSKYDEPDGRISWIVADIAPGELKTIEYMVEARYDGRYVNVARIDPYTLDGEELQQITVSSVVEIGPFEGAEVPPGWVPPDWDFEYYSYGCTSGQGCEDCSCLE